MANQAVPIASFYPMAGVMTVFSVQEMLDGKERKETDQDNIEEGLLEILTEDTLKLLEKVSEQSSNISEVPEDQIVVHNLDGPYLMKKYDWPKLVIPASEMEETERCAKKINGAIWDLTIEDTCKGKEMGQDSEMDHGWSVADAKKKNKSTKQKNPPAPTRSEMIPQDGIPILEKASTRAKQKNLETGNENDNNPFTVLNNTPNDYISNIIDGLDVVVDDKDVFINAIKAKEIVRAEIAEAKYIENT